MSDPNKPEDQKDNDTDLPASESDNAEPSAEDIWGDAFAEQADAEGQEEASAEDIWGDAFAEQEEVEQTQSTTTAATAASADDIFKSLDGPEAGQNHLPRELDVIMEIPVTMSVELGRTRLTIRQLLDLAKGSVVELEGLAGEPMDILVNGYLIAQGEVVVVDDKYGIRVTDIVNPTERIQRINR